MLEFLKIIIAFILFVIPGKVITDFFISKHFKDDFLKRLFFYFFTSCAFATIVGFLLGKLSMMKQSIVRNVYVAFLIFFLISILISLMHCKNPLKWRFKKIDKGYLWTFLPLIISLICFICYLGYENQPFPRGHDGSNHYIMITQLLNLGNTPSTEIGVMIRPFYYRGYHFAVAIFTLLSNVNVMTTLRLFNATMFSFLAITIYTFTDLFFHNKKSATLSSFAFLLISKPFETQGTYPMILTLSYIGILLIICQYIFEIKKFDVKHLIYFWLILTSLIVSHLICMQIFLFFLAGIIIFDLVYELKLDKVYIYVKFAFFLIIISFFSLIYYYGTQPNLFKGQLEFIFLRSTNFTSTNDLMHVLTFRTAVKEFLILFLTPYLIPFFIYGFIIALKKEKINLIAIASVAVTLLFAHILPIRGREPEILFYPFLSSVGVGIEQIIIKIKRNAKNLRNIASMYMIISSIFCTTQLAYVSSFPKIGAWIPLSEDNLRFCKLLNNKKIKNEIIAALSDPSARLIEAITDNKILIGDSRWHDIQSFEDIYKIFSSDTASHDVKLIIQKYNLSGIYVENDWINANNTIRKIVEAYPNCKIISYKTFKLILLNTAKNRSDTYGT